MKLLSKKKLFTAARQSRSKGSAMAIHEVKGYNRKAPNTERSRPVVFDTLRRSKDGYSSQPLDGDAPKSRHETASDPRSVGRQQNELHLKFPKESRHPISRLEGRLEGCHRGNNQKEVHP